MLKTSARIGSALAVASLALAPAMAKDTRSSSSVPSKSWRGASPAFQYASSRDDRDRRGWNDGYFDFAGDICDAPGNGKKTGHFMGNGKGHVFGRGRGHACDPKSPG